MYHSYDAGKANATKEGSYSSWEVGKWENFPNRKFKGKDTFRSN